MVKYAWVYFCLFLRVTKVARASVWAGVGCVIGASSLVVKMPRQPPRGSKRKRLEVEEMPSPQTLEFISHVRRGDKVVKKRTLEKVGFDPVSSPVVFPDDDVLPAPGSQVERPEPAGDASDGPSSDAGSRSVSVNLDFFCHVISHSRPSQAKVQEWISHRPEFLYELLSLEALSPQALSCSACQSSAEYRCLSCFTKAVVCRGCLLSRHSIAPLHNIQVRLLRFITGFPTNVP